MQKARVAMGVSVRDAADVTRLRADVIENMESGDFNFKLPEIYKRGFLRVYAAYLRLDVDTVMDEYTAAYRGSFDDGRRRNILSRMSSVSKAAEYEAPAPAPLESRFEEPEAIEEKEDADVDSSAKFIKLAAIFGGVILAVAVLILLVSSLVKKPVPDENPDIQMNANMPTQPAQTPSMNQVPTKPEKSGEMTLAVTATADTYVSIYPDGKPTEAFYAGPMQAGQTKTFKSSVPVLVRTSDAERIKLVRDSEPLNLKGAKGLRLFRIGLK